MLRPFYGQKATNLSSRDRVLPFMDTNLLNTKFTHIGARLKVADRLSRRSRRLKGKAHNRRNPARLAPGFDEHREPVEGHAERGVSRLTTEQIRTITGVFR
jgi:hypothetical protein